MSLICDERLIKYFWPKVNQTTGCWLWTGSQDSRGYGQIAAYFTDGHRRPEKAYRVAYILTHGSIPDACEIDHLCRVSLCVRPSHLEAVPHKTNIQRGKWGGYVNRNKTHCPRGHSYSGPDGRVNPAGSRYCLACQRTGPRSPTLNCPHGHPYNAANTYVRPDGYKECRTCRNARSS